MKLLKSKKKKRWSYQLGIANCVFNVIELPSLATPVPPGPGTRPALSHSGI